jgi:predicted dehydrogenase
VIPLLFVGFGRFAREYTLPRLAYYLESGDVRIVAITGLAGGSTEYETDVAASFAALGLQQPRYIPDLEVAAESVPNAERAASIITTPNVYHCEQATICLNLGFDVFVERPTVTQLDDLPGLAGLASSKGLYLFTGVQRRTEPIYKLLHEYVTVGRDFRDIESIKLTLRSGHRLRGWRSKASLSCGGVVLDSGYHLLDIAAWIVTDEPTMAGAFFKTDLCVFDQPPVGRVETTAVGHATLGRRRISLTFDFSYSAPLNSIYERIEFIDTAGSRVCFVRDQAKRSRTPGALAMHNTIKGVVENVNSMSKRGPGINSGDRTWGQDGPISRFITHLLSNGANVRDACDAKSAIPTWKLVRGIYANAQWVE